MKLQLFSDSAQSSNALLSMIESVVAGYHSQLHEKQLTLDLDIESVKSSPGLKDLEPAFASLLEAAIKYSAKGETISIGGYRASETIEIEVAIVTGTPEDSWAGILAPVSPAFSRQRTQNQQSGESTEHQVYATRCPQGGIAWTLVAGHAMPMEQRRAA